MSERLWHLLSGKLDEIAAFYKVRPRITLIVRVPGKPKECAFLSDDAWADAVATVGQLHGDPTAFAAGPPAPVAESPAPAAPDEVREAAVEMRRELQDYADNDDHVYEDCAVTGPAEDCPLCGTLRSIAAFDAALRGEGKKP